MKKILLSVCLLSSALFASISGVEEWKVINGLKKELNVPARIDKVSSIVEIYYNKKEKNVVLMYIIDSSSTFDKNKLKASYDKDFKKMTCNSELNKLFGDNKDNSVSYRIMFEGDNAFTLKYTYKDCH